MIAEKPIETSTLFSDPSVSQGKKIIEVSYPWQVQELTIANGSYHVRDNDLDILSMNNST